MQLEIEKRIFDHFQKIPFTKCCLGVKLILLFQTQFPLHIIIYLVSFMDCDIGIISKSRFTAKHNKKAKNLKRSHKSALHSKMSKNTFFNFQNHSEISHYPYLYFI